MFQTPAETQGEAGKADPEVNTAFDGFGSELPDEFFTAVVDETRERGWREVKL